MPQGLQHKHKKVAMACLFSAIGMVGLSYAFVPLYQMLCETTGMGGATQKALKPSETMLDRKITVRFDANVSPDLRWKFEPVQRTVDVRIGENVLAFYRVLNMSDKPIKGTATFNVAPEAAGLHFKKIECFCFKEQILEAGQSAELPVSFFVDPQLVLDPDSARIKEITLSYTFYPLLDGVEPQKQAKKDTSQDRKS